VVRTACEISRHVCDGRQFGLPAITVL